MNKKIKKFLQGELAIVFSNNRLKRVNEVRKLFKNMKTIDKSGYLNWEEEEEECLGFEPNIYAIRTKYFPEFEWWIFMIFTSQKSLEKGSRIETIPFHSIETELLL